MTLQQSPAPISITDAVRCVYQSNGRFVFARVTPLSLLAAAFVRLASQGLPFSFVFAIVVPLIYGIACAVALAPLLRYNRRAGGPPVTWSQYFAIVLAFALQALLLIGPWIWLDWMLSGIHEQHRNDYVAMVGSGGTLEEGATSNLILLFLCLYPILFLASFSAAPYLRRTVISPSAHTTPQARYRYTAVGLLALGLGLAIGLMRLFAPLLNPSATALAIHPTILIQLIGLVVSALVSAILTPLIAILTAVPYQPVSRT